MTDEITMLDEDETLALLRAGRTGTEPPLTDVTPLALRGGQRMRVRRRAGQVGAGIALLSLAAVAIGSAMPGLSNDRGTVVVPAGPGPVSTPAPRPNAATVHELQDANLRILASALGSDFWVAQSQGSPSFGWVGPKPGSEAANALPEGYTAVADVLTRPADEAEPCKPAQSKPRDTCERRTLSNGKSVLIRGIRSTPEPGTPFDGRHAYFSQPDGTSIDVSMFVTGNYTGPDDDIPVAQVDAWLDSYAEALGTAAADPGMRLVPDLEETGPSNEPNSAGRNTGYLAEALGAGWTLVGTNVETVSGVKASDGLPDGYRGRATVTASPGDRPVDVFCEPAGEVAGYSCDVKTTRDGLRVAVQRIPFQHFTNDLSIASIAVSFVRDSTTVRVELDALNQGAPAGEPSSIADQLQTWLAGFEDEITTAAVDPRMAIPDDEGESPTFNDVYGRNQQILSNNLGAGFRLTSQNVLLDAGSAEAVGLAGYTAEAAIRSGRSAVGLDRMCDASFDDVHTATCERRSTPAGDVIVQTWADGDSDLATQGRTAIYFLRPDHNGVVIHLLVREVQTPPGSAQERTDTIRAWLESVEAKLIAASIDPNIAPDGEPF